MYVSIFFLSFIYPDYFYGSLIYFPVVFPFLLRHTILVIAYLNNWWTLRCRHIFELVDLHTAT